MTTTRHQPPVEASSLPPSTYAAVEPAMPQDPGAPAKWPDEHDGDEVMSSPYPEVVALTSEVEALRLEVANLRADRDRLRHERDEALRAYTAERAFYIETQAKLDYTAARVQDLMTRLDEARDAARAPEPDLSAAVAVIEGLHRQLSDAESRYQQAFAKVPLPGSVVMTRTDLERRLRAYEQLVEEDGSSYDDPDEETARQLLLTHWRGILWAGFGGEVERG